MNAHGSRIGVYRRSSADDSCSVSNVATALPPIIGWLTIQVATARIGYAVNTTCHISNEGAALASTQIAPGCFEISLGAVNVFLLESENSWALIDTGFPNSAGFRKRWL
ncbi:MAG: hypothetical protein M3R61_12535 [Chloroflexota bacterium]|nr:hypothetical protein [Chloroflexota bacterium]